MSEYELHSAVMERIIITFLTNEDIKTSENLTRLEAILETVYFVSLPNMIAG